jgi:hypothetical protein
MMYGRVYEQDEKLSSLVSADSKLDGLDAACIGALASLAAQLATTPVSCCNSVTTGATELQ